MKRRALQTLAAAALLAAAITFIAPVVVIELTQILHAGAPRR